MNIMKLISQRTLEDLKPVLMEQGLEGDDVIYEVFTDIEKEGWVNMTILKPKKLGSEYPKTFGHYHSTIVDETYKVMDGIGFLLKQKKDDKGEIEEVMLVTLKPGIEEVITPEWGHCLVNTGDTDLVVVDNWSAGHEDHDYQEIKDHQGMAYYIIDEEGEPVPVKNPRYLNLADPLTGQ
jgi:glucose-6-phosphate isomerase, archaeal